MMATKSKKERHVEGGVGDSGWKGGKQL